MTHETALEMLSPRGQAVLAEASRMVTDESSRLNALQALRKRHSPELVAAVVDLILLRKRATVKFADAVNMYFTREALEQSSGQTVADYRAQRFARYRRVLDLGCGIGGDAMALAKAGCIVIAVDRDPIRLAMCTANAHALGLKIQTVNADIVKDVLPEADAVFCDPARRVEGKRVISPFDSEPSVRDVIARFPPGFPIGFKLAPGVDVDEAASLGGEVEFISLDGELKECCVWLGELKTTARRATVIRLS